MNIFLQPVFEKILITQHVFINLESRGHPFNPEIMFEYKIEDCFRAYFIRVGFVKQTTYTAPSLSYPLPDLTCRTFIPYLKHNSEVR